MISNLHPMVGILADDLTSAADGAGPFVQRGLSATVGRPHPPTSSLADAVAVDMATRSVPVREAMASVERSVRLLDGAGILLKTVDSTLRGHVRAEIETAYKTSRRSRLVFAPSFPEAGRVTRNGIQHVDGVPVAESAYGKDPVHPARTSRLSELVPSLVRSAVLLDAETQADLDAQVAAIPELEDTLWVGSPGLAIALSRAIAPRESVQCLPSAVGRVFVVVGSANGISTAQAEAAEAIDGVDVLRAPSKRGDPTATLYALTERAASALHSGRYGAVLAAGGDTMEAVLDAVGIGAFDLVGEFEPGFPAGVASLGDRSLVLGMKAGGFGAPDTLVRAVQRLIGTKELVG
ncbi:MAG: four-carbon acid sugar kinase family protein [Pseudomonadota bacterium]